MQPSPETLDLAQVLDVLHRRLLLVVLCLFVVAVATYVFSGHEAKKYTATSAVVFSNNSLSQQIAGVPGTTGSSQAQAANDLELVRLGDMAAKTASILGHGLTENAVSSSLSIVGKGESSAVSVSATTSSPGLAAAIANTYAKVFVNEQKSASLRYFGSALALVNKQLAAIPAKLRSGAAANSLQARAQTLRLLDELGYGNVQVAQEATPPAGASSPKVSRNVAVGAALGLLIGLALAFVLERLDRDRRIREPDDLATTYRLPLLDVVPASQALAHPERGDSDALSLPPAEAEVFRLIRAHLRVAMLDRELRTVMIASAEAGDGKTTIAVHLASAAAAMGSRVLLLEADLRHPTVAQHLSVHPGPGLPEVLVGTASLGEATQTVRLPTPSEGEPDSERTLDVLASGALLPANPGALLEGDAMLAVLEYAEATYDLVIVDTPPLSAVSDAFPLLRKVDGVIIVGRVGASQRDAVRRLAQTLGRSGAALLGVIANDAKAHGAASYKYPAGTHHSGAEGLSRSDDEPAAEEPYMPPVDA